jgi:hypothetical protein
MPTLKPGTQEYRDYYNAITLPGDTPPAQQQDEKTEDGDSGGIRSPMSDRDEFYSKQPNVPPKDIDKPYDASEHTPKTEKGKAADARLRADQARTATAQQQRALDDLSSKTKAEKMAAALEPGKVVGRWSLQTENGRKFFMAVSEEQALREARRAGLHPTSAKLTSVHTYTEDELSEAYAKIGKCGARASRQAEFEKAIKMGLIPESAEFETIGDREWGYRVGKHDPIVHKASEKEWVYQPPAERAALARLEKYWDGTGYNLVAAISDGVTDGTLYRAGFVPADVKEIRDWVKKHDEVLAKLKPYWSEGEWVEEEGMASPQRQPGYNIEAALKAGAVSASDLIDVGFERADILQATEVVSTESFPATKRHEQFDSATLDVFNKGFPELAERLKAAGLEWNLATIKKIDREMKDRDVFAVGDAPTADKFLEVVQQAKADGLNAPGVDYVWRVWHQAADEYKSWLIGLPREHPEKKAMLRRVGNVVLAATTVLLPGVQAAATGAGRAAMSLLGPALKSRRVAQVAQSAVGFVSNVLVPSSVLTADAAVANELLNADNMQRTHEAFLLLPADEQDYWKKKAGVDPSKPCGDADMARVLAHYSVPPGYSLAEWSGALQEATDRLGNKADNVASWVREHTPDGVSEPVIFAGNTAVGVVEGLSYGAQLPMIAATIADRVPEGDAKEYAAQVAAGMVAFFTAIPSKVRADPAATSGRLVGMFILGPNALVKYAKGLGVRLDPRFIAKRALGTEFTTLRISPPSGSVAKRSDWVAVKAQIGNAKRIVLDLDGTLVDGNGKLLPGAKAFVTGLKASGRELILWTHSTEGRASAILSETGLRRYFDTVVTRETYEPTGTNPTAFKDIRRVNGDVLVDDVAATNPAYAKAGVKVVAPSVGGTIRISPKEMMKLTDELVRQSIFTRTKVARATIKTKAGEWVAEIRNTPYQRVLEGSSFHFTSDITPFLKGKRVIVKDLPLFHSPQAAIEFAVQHWTGRPMVRPGLVEIHMTKPELRGLTKILNRGVAEFEGSFAPGTELHAVPGFNGRGVSFDLRAGEFPIVRYTTAGAKGWRGPTLKQVAQVQVEAAKAATADFVLGWYGRQIALKDALFKKDWKLARIHEAIEQLKVQKPETIGPDGEIVGLRSPVPHPDGKGTIRPRVTGIIHHPENGRILLVMDKVEKSFSLPGGHILQAWRPGALGFKKLADGRVVNTFEGALDGQMRTETGVGITNAKPLDIYRGKVNEHAMAGSRVYEATATSANLDPAAASRQYSKSGVPELQQFLWWDGKSDVTVSPATRDILLGVAKKHKLDMAKVHVDKGNKLLLKSRDLQYFYRVRSGTPITEKQIAAINQREIDALKWQRSEHLKGQTPGLADFLEAEPDFRSVVEFLEGRRRIVKTYTAGKTDAVVERAIAEAQLTAQYREAMKVENRAERAERVADVYDEAVRAHLDTGRLAEPYRDALYAASRENMPAYASRYLHYYRRATQSRGDPVRGIRVAHEDEGMRALREYRDVYRATSEPYRTRYDSRTEQVRRVAESRRTTDRVRTEVRGGDYRTPTGYRDTPQPPVEEPVTPRAVPTPPETEERAPRLRKAVVGTKPDRKTTDATGEVQWKQGKFWIKVEPPPVEGERHKNVQYSRRPFWGVRIVKGTPEQTFAFQGKPPKWFRYDMGITHADIFPREKPHLRYRQTGAGRAKNRTGRRGRLQR